MSREKPVLKLYNTETRRNESVPTDGGNRVRMYACGPTVYNYAHIGNLRTYIFEDLLRRTLLFYGYDVFHVMNITDVDDKTIREAKSAGLSLEAFTKKYTDAFFDDLHTLKVQKAESYPSAVAHIPEMIAMIEKLVREGIAYQGTDKSIYFSIRKFPSYGRLSHFCLEDLKEGGSQRLESDEYEKETAADFVLWKAYDPTRDGEIYWESPFGRGRPGWHIECSAMARKSIGETVDIHCGGVDNMFPHHENEIAQSESCSGKKFVQLWMHAQHLIVDGKKMSKSLGNFYTLRDLTEKGFSGEEVRFLLLQTHYRTQLNFTLEGLFAARKSLQRIRDCLDRIEHAAETAENHLHEVLEDALYGWKKALGDDLNIAEALAALFDAVRFVNSSIDTHQGISSSDKKKVYAFFEQIDSVLACLPLEKTEETLSEDLQEAVRLRAQARKDKNWSVADAQRDYIHSCGYEIEDTPTGTVLKKKSK